MGNEAVNVGLQMPPGPPAQRIHLAGLIMERLKTEAVFTWTSSSERERAV
jgi:hypothetical protein